MQRHHGLERSGVEDDAQAGELHDVSTAGDGEARPYGKGDGRSQYGGHDASDLDLGTVCGAMYHLDGADGQAGAAVDPDDVEGAGIAHGREVAEDAVAEVGQPPADAEAGPQILLGEDAVGGAEGEGVGPAADESAEGRYERGRVEVEVRGGDGAPPPPESFREGKDRRSKVARTDPSSPRRRTAEREVASDLILRFICGFLL